MDRGTYAAASDGLMQLRKLDITTNNIANVKTAGFKKQVLIVSWSDNKLIEKERGSSLLSWFV